jgi:hypothetical protein
VKTRCAFIKASELRAAKAHCDAAFKSAEAARAVYRKARPAEVTAKQKARVKTSESREQDRRNAVARVVGEHQVPELVAEYAVRAVERRGVRGSKQAHRWERLAEGVTGRELAAAWKRYELEAQRKRPLERLARRFAPTKKKRAAPKRKRAARAPDVIILDADDFEEVPF